MKPQTTKSISSLSTNGITAASWRLRAARKSVSRGQSAVEFALMSVFALAVMLLGVQYALIGQAAVAVSQGSSALARYAASEARNSLGTYNGSIKASALPVGVQQLLSSSILTNGGNDLTITVTSNTGAGVTETNLPPPGGDQLVVSLSYATTSKLAVPNPFLAIPPIFGGITFPATVGATSSQMYED
jgi:Flp pilus assembly protein TadG